MVEDDIQQDWILNLTNKGQLQSTITIQANPDFASKVTGRLEPYKNFPAKFAPALEGVADYITQVAIPRVFKNEGPGWRRLSKRTQRERAAAGYNPTHPILVRTGDLFSELTKKSHPKHIEIIKTGSNARVTIGGSSEKFLRNQLGSSVINIPARPMIPGTGWVPLDPIDDQRLRTIIKQSIESAMKQ